MDFWFNEIKPAQWFKKSVSFDQEIGRRFSKIHAQANACELFSWRDSAQGRLAEIIVLDQFSRNIYRGSAASFGSDALALALAQETVALKQDQQLTPIQRNFLYMPYMHSESPVIHDIAVDLFTNNTKANNLEFELRHKAIIDRFGRYPHRNKVLQRASTTEEIEFLQKPGSSF